MAERLFDPQRTTPRDIRNVLIHYPPKPYLRDGGPDDQQNTGDWRSLLARAYWESLVHPDQPQLVTDITGHRQLWSDHWAMRSKFYGITAGGHAIEVDLNGLFSLEDLLKEDIRLLADQLRPGRYCVSVYQLSSELVRAAQELGRYGIEFIFDQAVAVEARQNVEHPFHRGPWGRSIDDPTRPSFPERYGIPYPVSYRARGATEMVTAFDRIMQWYQDNDAQQERIVYVKLIESAGGCGIGVARSEADILRIYDENKERGMGFLFPDGELIFELQASLGDQIPIVSYQFSQGEITTPGTLTTQNIGDDGISWGGNNFRVIYDPRILNQCTRLHHRLMTALQRETGVDRRLLVGGVDGAIVPINGVQTFVPFEVNIPRNTGAVIPIMLMEALKLNGTVIATKVPGVPQCTILQLAELLHGNRLPSEERALITAAGQRGVIPITCIPKQELRLLIHGATPDDAQRILDSVSNILDRSGAMVR